MISSTENPFQFGTKRPSKASIDVALPKPGGRQVWFLRGIARRILRLTSFDGCGVLRRKVFYGMRALLTGTLFRPAGVQVRDIKGLCKSLMTLAPPRTTPPPPTSHTRQRRHISRFVLPHSYACGHVADAVALGGVVEQVVLFIGVRTQIEQLALITCAEKRAEFPVTFRPL